jgi:hypothetical protein
MIRATLATLTALTLGLSTASADEFKGTLKKVNQNGHSLTLSVDGKDRVLPVSKDATFVSVLSKTSKKGKVKDNETPIDGGLGGLKEGSAVTVLTSTEGKKETVTTVKVTGAGKTKKAKKPKKVAEILQPISVDTPNGDNLAPGKKVAKGDKAKKKAGKKAKKKAGKKKAKKGAKKKGKKSK